MEWTPDAVRTLADRMERQLDRPVSKVSAETLRLVVRALRHYAAEGYATPSERLVIEVSDLRRGTADEIVAEVADIEAAEAVVTVMARKRPGCRVLLRKRGWIMRVHQPDNLT